MKRTEKGYDLARFGNALRNFLDLEPLYQAGCNGKPSPKAREVERFYPGNFSLSSTLERQAAAHGKAAAR